MPEIPHRKSIRLPDFDYSQNGAYFVTIVTENRLNLFGDIIDGEMRLNKLGEIVQQCWMEIPNHISNVHLDRFVVMPNHIHGVFIIVNGPQNATHVEATHASPLHGNGPRPKSVGVMVGSHKSAVTRLINILKSTPGQPVWQRNYYDRIVRNDRELDAIRLYIQFNPQNWVKDKENQISEYI